MAGPRSNAAPSRDGRLLGGGGSREAIVGALFELVGAGVLKPTAQQVAERAGVGIRSVFRHFDDMDSLFAAMDEKLSAEVLPILRERAAGGSLRERARALAQRRGRLFERIGPYKRSANVQRWRSNFLRTRHALVARELRADLLRSLPELEDAPAETLEASALAA